MSTNMDPIAWIDSLLNRITMYRVVLYYLIALILIAMVFAAFGMLPYDPMAIGFSALFLVFFSEWFNDIFAKVFRVPVNVESTTITALILACIVTPVKQLSDFIPLIGFSAAAVASKYMLAVHKKHVFNPAAAAAVISSALFRTPATWWVGNPALAVFVVIGGLLVVRKIRREPMVWIFFGTVLLVSTILTLMKGSPLLVRYSQLTLHSSMLFFAFVMLTEPLTSPPTTDLQVAYAAIVGFLFYPDIHIGSLYSTPELSLIVGNIFSYIVSPKEKLVLYLKEKIMHSSDTVDFVFHAPFFNFTPGQYMEWTLPHEHPDSRGNRRYFTIASSPKEGAVRLGIKFYDKPSSYKKALLSMSLETPIVAGQRAGEFVLPKDPKQKIVCIAGGIGVTPFRSIILDLLDRHEPRDIVLLYANKVKQDIVYTDVFTRAFRELNIRTIYTLTDIPSIPQDWQGARGRIDSNFILKEIPDWRERLFYLSGPYAMVTGYERVLIGMGLARRQIKKDFFPGFA